MFACPVPTPHSYATPACFDSCKKQDEELLATNLYNHGPVSICVAAATWQYYTGGILSGKSGCKNGYYELDHCVQLVGYGVESVSGAKFWSARNSVSGHNSNNAAHFLRRSVLEYSCDGSLIFSLRFSDALCPCASAVVRHLG